MTPDLAAINKLAQDFANSIDTLPTWDSPLAQGAIHLGQAKSRGVLDAADNITALYKKELEKAPDDLDVKNALAQHYQKVGYLYHCGTLWGVYSTSNFNPSEAREACSKLWASYVTAPNQHAAYLLAGAFETVKFYGTAIYWYRQVEDMGSSMSVDAKADRMRLEAAGNTSDPPVTENPMEFPNAFTDGLHNPVVKASKGGCGSAVIVFLLVSGTLTMAISKAWAVVQVMAQR